jgi:signal transduction histidine kinase
MRSGLSARRRVRVGWTMFGVTVALLSGMVVLSAGREEAFDTTIYGLLSFALAGVGALIVSRHPWNGIGWIFCGLGLWAAIAELGEGWGYWAAERDLFGGAAGEWIITWSWIVDMSGWALVLLLFPNGHLPGRRWRLSLWVLGIGLPLAVLGQGLATNTPESFSSGANPLGTKAIPTDTLFSVGMMLVLATTVAGLVALIVRFRRSTGVERQQLKWFATAAVFTVVIGGIAPFLWYKSVLIQVLVAVSLITLPIAAGISIFKYRLYDIDVVINKTIVFGALAAFITGIYVAIVVGIGTLLGSSDEPNLALSIAATAVVAIAFSPVRDRVQKVANRLVYGKRQTPYEAIARFADEVVSSYETHQVAPAIATTIAEATGAARAHVWLKVDDTLVCEATHPDTEHQATTVTLDGDDLPALEGIDLAVAVVHNKELLGALSLTKKKGEQPQPQDRKLLDDLSSQAGIVLANARMTAELETHLAHITAQAQDIKESRQRIVAAQDKERRRLERDIHDGAQQHLVALAVKLNLAKTTATRKPEKAPALLAQLKGDTQEALATLSDLAKGIYPPVLKDHGIATALKPIADKAPFEVAVDDHTSGRFDEAVEAAVYFCCLEALQNTAKYAGATHATVTLTETDDTLGFVVTDDGAGFDTATTTGGTGTQGMADRLAALDGTLTVTSAPGQGTTVTGAVPIRQRSMA